MSNKFFNIFIFLILSVIFWASSWSLFKPGLFPVHDVCHSARIVAMTKALDDGHFPVRWVDYFGMGYGMPLFEFYAPLPFYVGSLIYGLTNNIVWSIKILYLLTSILTAIGSYLLGKELTQRKYPALLISAAISLAPYRAVDLFVRGALSEAWAIMALTWIIFGSLMIFHQQARGKWILIFSLVTLFLSHNLTTMIFIPLWILLIVIWLLVNKYDRKVLLQIIKEFFFAVAMALGLAAFYLLPALVEQKYTIVFNQAISSFHYFDYFVFIRQLIIPLWGYGGAAPGPYNDQSNFLGYGQLLSLLSLLVLLALYLMIRKNVTVLVRQIFGLGFLFFLSLFMLHGRSQWIWQNVNILAIFQFPWRWLSLVIIWLGMLSGLGSLLIKNSVVRNCYCLVLTIIIILGNFSYFQPKTYLTNYQNIYLSDPNLISQQNGPGYIDYLPLGLTDLQVSSGSSLTKQVDKTQEKIIVTNYKQPQKISWGILNFPGWQTTIDDQDIESVEFKYDQLETIVPAGHHQIAIKFGYTPIRFISDLISLSCWLVLLSYLTVTLFAMLRGLSTS